MGNKRIKQTKYSSDETKEVKTLIILTVIIIAIAAGMYFLTDLSLKKKEANSNLEPNISYSVATIGTMFNRPDSEYYVFAYGASSEDSKLYEKLLSSYEDKEAAIKTYYIDLDLNFNNYALSDKSNKNPKNPEEVKINKAALILIKNGKVQKYFETTEEIEKALS